MEKIAAIMPFPNPLLNSPAIKKPTPNNPTNASHGINQIKNSGHPSNQGNDIMFSHVPSLRRVKVSNIAPTTCAKMRMNISATMLFNLVDFSVFLVVCTSFSRGITSTTWDTKSRSIPFFNAVYFINNFPVSLNSLVISTSSWLFAGMVTPGTKSSWLDINATVTG